VSEYPRGWQSALARSLGVSRQRVWSMLREAGGACVTCGKPREQYALYCDQHAAIQADTRWRQYGKQLRRNGPYGPRKVAP
jgi:hypothetical protein